MLANNVQESTTSTGTGNITLGGSSENGRTFSSQFSITPTERFRYNIDDGSGNFEAGWGYLTNSTTLVRELVTDSSNGGNLVNFGAGTKQVFIADVAENYPFPRATATIGNAASVNIVFPTWFVNQATNMNGRTTQMWLTPFTNDCPTEFSEWAVYVRTAASEVIRMAVYDVDPATGLPIGSPLMESDDISLSSTGIATSPFSSNVSGTTSNKRLPRAFWLGMSFSGATGRVLICNYTQTARAWTSTDAAGRIPSYFQPFTLGTPTAGQPAMPTIGTLGSRSENFPIGGFR